MSREVSKKFSLETDGFFTWRFDREPVAGCSVGGGIMVYLSERKIEEKLAGIRQLPNRPRTAIVNNPDRIDPYAGIQYMHFHVKQPIQFDLVVIYNATGHKDGLVTLFEYFLQDLETPNVLFIGDLNIDHNKNEPLKAKLIATGRDLKFHIEGNTHYTCPEVKSDQTDHKPNPTDHKSNQTDHKLNPTDHKANQTDHEANQTDHRSNPTDPRLNQMDHKLSRKDCKSSQTDHIISCIGDTHLVVINQDIQEEKTEGFDHYLIKCALTRTPGSPASRNIKIYQPTWERQTTEQSITDWVESRVDNGVCVLVFYVEILRPIKLDKISFKLLPVYQSRLEIKPDTLGAKPSTPKTKSITPETEPGTPKTEPGTPETEPGTPKIEPGTPGAQPSTPKTESITPETEPGTPKTKPGTPKTEPGTPGAKPGTPKTEPGTPKTEPGTPKTEPGAPKTEPGTPKIEPGTPGAKPSTPETESITPEAEPGTPKTEPGTPKIEPGTPGAKPSTPKTEPDTPKTEPGTPKTEPGTLKTEPGTPKTEPGTLKTEPGTPKTVPDTPETEPDTPSVKPSTLPEPITLVCIGKADASSNIPRFLHCFERVCYNLQMSKCGIISQRCSLIHIKEEKDLHKVLSPKNELSEKFEMCASRYHMCSEPSSDCHMIFRDETALMEHAKSKHGASFITCKSKNCQHQFLFEDLYDRHLERMHKELKRSECPISDKCPTLIFSENLKSHVLFEHLRCLCKYTRCQGLTFKHVKDDHKCKICPNSATTYYPSQIRLDEHIRKHNNGMDLRRSFDCLKCERVFKKEKTFREHLNSCYIGKPFQCIDCGKRYQMKAWYRKHEEGFHHICEFCREKYVNQGSYAKHILKCWLQNLYELSL